jgi:plasmid stability protein
LEQNMSTLVIKNVPEPLHAALKETARRHHRSVTKETISLIEAGVGGANHAHAVPDRPAAAMDDVLDAIEDGRFAHYRSLEDVNAYVDELRQDRDDVAR